MPQDMTPVASCAPPRHDRHHHPPPSGAAERRHGSNQHIRGGGPAPSSHQLWRAAVRQNCELFSGRATPHRRPSQAATSWRLLEDGPTVEHVEPMNPIIMLVADVNSDLLSAEFDRYSRD